jgi:hypothetical protein
VKSFSLLISKEDLKVIRALVGQTWRSISGRRFTSLSEHVLGSIEVIKLRTSNSNIDVTLKQIWSDFEGVEDDYDVLGVAQTSGDMTPAENEGEIDFTFAQQKIEAISIVRVRILHSRFGASAWELISDSGLVFQLSGGVVGIFKVTLTGSRSFNTVFAKEASELRFDDRSSEWTEGAELGEEYQVSREFIPIDDLLKAVGG